MNFYDLTITSQKLRARNLIVKHQIMAKPRRVVSFRGEAITKYGKTGIEYVEQMTYAVGSLTLKSIVCNV